MAMESKVMDDLARMAGGAMGTVFGLRDEAAAQMRQQVERALHRLDLVTREEFETVASMAQEARLENAALTERIAALEAQLSDLSKKPVKATGNIDNSATPSAAKKPRRTTRRTTKASSAGTKDN